MRHPKPIKRHPSLQPISRQHHFGLLFTWKIRKGLAMGISAERMKAYRDWFFQKEILQHFELEEKHVFKILGEQNSLVERALEEHVRLKELFQREDDILNALKDLEKELTAHIRFEERILFHKIEEIAQPEQLKLIDQLHIPDMAKKDEYHDPFWI